MVKRYTIKELKKYTDYEIDSIYVEFENIKQKYVIISQFEVEIGEACDGGGQEIK